MSTAVFPTLPGLGFDITRSPDWSGNTVTESVSGKRTGTALWTYPRWKWELKFNYLRTSIPELQTLAGFINARRGTFDTFLYSEPDDNTAAGVVLGVGDGATTTFQLQRAYGGFLEPIFAPNLVSTVYQNGVAATGWAASAWSSSTPGVVTFATAPAAGVTITADFSFYFPCRFDSSAVVFTKMFAGFYKADSLIFSSEK